MAIERDAFFTPDHISLACVQALYEAYPELEGKPVVEPSAGAGSFLRAFDSVGKSGKVRAFDLKPLAEGIEEADYLEDQLEPFEPGTVVIGNPPYGRWQGLVVSFVRRSFELGADKVAMLLMSTAINASVLKRINRKVEGWWGLPGAHFILEDGSKSTMNEALIFIIFGRDELQPCEPGPWKKLKSTEWGEATFSSSIWKARGEIDFRLPPRRVSDGVRYFHTYKGKLASEFLYSGPIPDFRLSKRWYLCDKMDRPSTDTLSWLNQHGDELYQGVLDLKTF